LNKMDLKKLTIPEINNGLKNKEFSASELARTYLDKVKSDDDKIHAYLTVTEDLAMAQAKAVDDKIAAGEETGILAGVPIAIKDNILIEDIKCTAGSKILANYIAPYDATVIKKLQQTGSVLLGKTNLDEFAMGGSTENSAYGATHNPRDLERVPGGSSGGSAAAVAADMCVGALGSDTGGSIRQPASFCGVVGLKPTYGAVSRYGVMAMASSLDQIGPMAKNVADCRALFDCIKGKDRYDATSAEILQATNHKPQIANLKIGIPKEYFSEGIDSDVEKTIKNTISKLAAEGAKITEINLPHTPDALACYYVIVPSEVSSNLARYDGIKYGARATDIKNLLDVYLNSRGQYLGKEVRRRIMLGTYALSAGYYDAYYLKAQKVRAKIKEDFDEAFRQVDLILGPVTPTTAFKIGEKADDPVQMYLSDVYTVPINLAGLPALSMPCGLASGLPVGLQIIGPHFSEDLIFEFGRHIEEII